MASHGRTLSALKNAKAFYNGRRSLLDRNPQTKFAGESCIVQKYGKIKVNRSRHTPIIDKKYRYDVILANPPFGARAGVVIKNTFLSNTDNASIVLRKYLLESCNVKYSHPPVVGR
jgi:hypothetical protein